MFIDSRTIPNGQLITTDICVIGAGAAGITLARELIGQPFKVCLLESGGLELDAETQDLCKGENVGHPYFPLESTHLRYFGGTTNHWSGLARPIDPVVFGPREWVPGSGWPFDRAHLEPFYMRAQPICELGPFAYEHNNWETRERPCLPLDGKRIQTGFVQFSHVTEDPGQAHARSPVRFGTRYRGEIERAGNVDTYLQANVLELETDEPASTVTRARVASLEGNVFRVAAKLFVVATGGIENARLLLLSNAVQKVGLGNGNDLVGRYFAEHAFLYSGQMLLTNPDASYSAYELHANNGTQVRGFLYPSAEIQRQVQLLNCGIGVGGPVTLDSVESLRAITKAARRAELPDHLSEHLYNVITDIDDVVAFYYRKLRGQKHSHLRGIRYWAEQAPNPDSRVTLGTERDRLGQPRVRLDWRFTSLDLHTMKQAHQILAQELGRAGLGRIKIELAEDDEAWLSPVHGGYHHMGTTRMHVDPSQGVVDPNCRVHGISNLFMAGSSVFPVYGHANPTLTIVALTLRLADHIKGLMV